MSPLWPLVLLVTSSSPFLPLTLEQAHHYSLDSKQLSSLDSWFVLFCCLDLSYQEWTDFLACLPGVIPTGSSAKEFPELDHDSLSPGGCGAPSRCPWLPLPAAFSSCSCFSSSPWLLSCTCLCGGRLPAFPGWAQGVLQATLLYHKHCSFTVSGETVTLWMAFFKKKSASECLNTSIGDAGVGHRKIVNAVGVFIKLLFSLFSVKL